LAWVGRSLGEAARRHPRRPPPGLFGSLTAPPTGRPRHAPSTPTRLKRPANRPAHPPLPPAADVMGVGADPPAGAGPGDIQGWGSDQARGGGGGEGRRTRRHWISHGRRPRVCCRRPLHAGHGRSVLRSARCGQPESRDPHNRSNQTQRTGGPPARWWPSCPSCRSCAPSRPSTPAPRARWRGCTALTPPPTARSSASGSGWVGVGVGAEGGRGLFPQWGRASRGQSLVKSWSKPGQNLKALSLLIMNGVSGSGGEVPLPNHPHPSPSHPSPYLNTSILPPRENLSTPPAVHRRGGRGLLPPGL
jgi:hypothetical protein